MYKVVGYFRNHTVTKYFIDKYDAIDFKGGRHDDMVF